LNSFLKARMAALKASLREEGLDGYIVSNEANILYLTGFLGGVRLLIPEEGENHLYVYGVNYESAKRTAKNCGVELVERRGDTDMRIADLVRGLRLGRVGFDIMEASVYLKLAEALKDVRLNPRGKLLWRLREVKDEEELKCMRRAAELTSEGVKTAFETVRSGLREYELAAEIEYAMRRMGSEGVAFDTIVASGVRSAFPHGGCTDRKIRKGDLVLIDVGAKYRHYRADLSRTVAVGKPSPEQKKIHETVREAHQKVLEILRAGVKACDADAVARGLISGKGYGGYFVHSLGHGVGLDVQEPPALSQENEEALRAGNVVTVEPGIYLAGFGGVRVEDTVLVLEDGAERLTTAPYALEVE